MYYLLLRKGSCYENPKMTNHLLLKHLYSFSYLHFVFLLLFLSTSRAVLLFAAAVIPQRIFLPLKQKVWPVSLLQGRITL